MAWPEGMSRALHALKLRVWCGEEERRGLRARVWELEQQLRADGGAAAADRGAAGGPARAGDRGAAAAQLRPVGADQAETQVRREVCRLVRESQAQQRWMAEQERRIEAEQADRLGQGIEEQRRLAAVEAEQRRLEEQLRAGAAQEERIVALEVSARVPRSRQALAVLEARVAAVEAEQRRLLRRVGVVVAERQRLIEQQLRDMVTMQEQVGRVADGWPTLLARVGRLEARVVQQEERYVHLAGRVWARVHVAEQQALRLAALEVRVLQAELAGSEQRIWLEVCAAAEWGLGGPEELQELDAQVQPEDVPE